MCHSKGIKVGKFKPIGKFIPLKFNPTAHKILKKR